MADEYVPGTYDYQADYGAGAYVPETYDSLSLDLQNLGIYDSGALDYTPPSTNFSVMPSEQYSSPTLFPDAYSSPAYADVAGYTPNLDVASWNSPTFQSAPLQYVNTDSQLPQTSADDDFAPAIGKYQQIIDDPKTPSAERFTAMAQRDMLLAKRAELAAMTKKADVDSKKLDLAAPNETLEWAKIAISVGVPIVSLAMQDAARRKSEKNMDDAQDRIDARLEQASTEQEALAAKNDQIAYQAVKERQAFADKAWGMVSF